MGETEGPGCPGGVAAPSELALRAHVPECGMIVLVCGKSEGGVGV
jgi:hypothetical protein